MNNSILVIEDNFEMQELLITLLDQAGYEVIPATTGSEALSILRLMPELMMILLDLTLPDMQTKTFLDQLKIEQLADAVPILFFSANPDVEKMKRPERVVGAIQKPFQIQSFMNTLEGFKSMPLQPHSSSRCCPSNQGLIA